MGTRASSFFVAALLTIGLCVPSYAADFDKNKARQTPATKALKGGNLKINKLSATLTASPTAYTGACPAVITFNGSVRYLGTGKVYYSFVRSDGGTLPFARDRFIRFDAPGTQPVSQTWTLGGPTLPSYTGWEMLKLSTCPPGVACPDAINADSNRAPFSMNCGQVVTPSNQGDLIARAVQALSPFSPANQNPRVGQSVSINCQFEFQGPASLPANTFFIKWMVDGSVIEERLLDLALAPNSSIGSSANWTPATPGIHTLKCVVDSRNQVLETTEANNTATANVSVSP